MSYFRPRLHRAFMSNAGLRDEGQIRAAIARAEFVRKGTSMSVSTPCFHISCLLSRHRVPASGTFGADEGNLGITYGRYMVIVGAIRHGSDGIGTADQICV